MDSWAHLSVTDLRKMDYNVRTSLSGQLSDEKNNFSNTVPKSADLCKNNVFLGKSKLFEKIRHFEKFKNFFSWI